MATAATTAAATLTPTPMPITTAAIITIIIITGRPTVTTTITPDLSGPLCTTAFTTFARPSDAIPHPPPTATNFYSCKSATGLFVEFLRPGSKTQKLKCLVCCFNKGKQFFFFFLPNYFRHFLIGATSL